MTWTKLGDEFGDETMDLSSDAFRLHVEALVWSNRKLADLTIPARMLPRLSALGDPGPAVDELIRAGWWQQVDEGAFWIGCRFSEWQRDRADVEYDRDRNTRNQRRRRLHLRGDHSMCLTGRCQELSPGDTPSDTPSDYADTSGRDGAGRVATPNPALDKEGRVCCVCGTAGSLLAGKDGQLRCRRHHFDQAAA